LGFGGEIGTRGAGAKMGKDGRSHCATAIRNSLGSKIEGSSEGWNPEHDTREIQGLDG
jgi:hypothetical protein